MGKPHKHAELIKAWADGAEIQYKNALGEWADCSPRPAWDSCVEYRIKPEPVRLKYRRYIRKTLNGELLISTVNSVSQASPASVQNSPSFVKWIDYVWQVVEV